MSEQVGSVEYVVPVTAKKGSGKIALPNEAHVAAAIE